MKKILIVEDDQLLNRTLAYNLTSDGYEVISFARHGRALAGESPEHAQVVGNV